MRYRVVYMVNICTVSSFLIRIITIIKKRQKRA